MDHFFYLYNITNKEVFESKTFMESEIQAANLYTDKDFRYCLSLEKDYNDRPFRYMKEGREPVSYFRMDFMEQTKLIQFLFESRIYDFTRLEMEDEETGENVNALLQKKHQNRITDEKFKEHLADELEFVSIKTVQFKENRVHFKLYPNGILIVRMYPTQGTLSSEEAKEHAETFYNLLLHLFREEKENIQFYAFEMKEKQKRKHELHRSHDVLSYLFSSVDQAELQNQLGMDEKEYARIKEDLEKHATIYKDKYVYTR